MHVVAGTAELQFPYFVTNKANQVVAVNELLQKDISANIVNCHVNDVFTEWEEVLDYQMVRAKVADERYFFIRKEMTNGCFIYIGDLFDEVNELLEEVEELRKVNRNLDAIIESSYDGIYITDKNGITLKTNSAIERITGIPKEYYMNKNVDYLITRGILKESVTQKVLQKKGTVSLLQLNHRGQETLLTGSPVFDEKGEIESIVTNIRDLSDLQELQRAYLEADKLNESYLKEIKRLKENMYQIDNETIVKGKEMQLIYETANRIVNVDATVLILGETGVGKDVLAKHIYNNSERSKKGEFVKVNCGAIPPDLLESELFGYVGGAFTGANKQGKPGMFEIAHKGVLFLDEIGEMPLNLQVKLLRAIQEREIRRVGGTDSIKVDVRLIAATHRELKEMVAAGKFREDLYYRLNVIPILIPPLRERREEILPLSYMYLEKMNKKYKTNKKLNDELKSFIYHNEWVGNVRELFNFIERITLLNDDDLLGLQHLPGEYQANSLKFKPQVQKSMSLKEAVEMAEKQLLKIAIEKCETTYDIAKMLDTSQPTIVRRLKKYKLEL